MGILTNAKQFLARKAVSAAKKAGDGIATLSSLSPKQLQEVEAKRGAYLADKPDMTGEEVQSVIQKHMGAIGIEVYQAYLQQLSTIYAPMDVMPDDFDEDNRIRFFEITKWVRDSEEKSLDKLINVYHVLSGEECNIALIYHRKKDVCRVYIGVVNTNERWSDPAIVDEYYSRLVGAIKGNFPGTDIKEMGSLYRDYGVGIPECLEKIHSVSIDGRTKSVAIVSNVASEKSENFVSQSMDKLLDGIVPEDSFQEYMIVLLAKPVRDQLESKNRLYELYTELAPYESWQTGYTYTESDGISSSANFGVNLGVSAGVHSVVNTAMGTSNVHTDQKGSSDSVGGHVGAKGKIVDVGGDYHHTWQRGQSDAVGTNESQGKSSGCNASANFGISFSRSSSVTAQVGKNESISQSYTNYGVKHTLEIIDSQLRRIEESAALGMWEFASYIVSDSPVITNNVAHMYLALTQGEESYISESAINFWDGDVETDAAGIILENVRRLQHPVFGLISSLEDEWLMYPTLVIPTTPLSGKELAKALNFPRKSVSGLPVLEVVPFGREPHSLLDIALDMEIGCGYHMRRKIPEQRIRLSKQELAKHTFITGSTGAGKSNTIYTILDSLSREKVKFMVIEPAKGEYKTVLGKRSGVVTYGTNPMIKGMQLLKINPFGFPDSVHVLEHMDRLVEIFNVCWPMYAAMPAILKDSVERAYAAAGWNMETSQNKYGVRLFPSFTDVVKQIRKVLEESDYSDDNKGDYIGSLVTRLRSLTNGIYGMIFCCDDLSDELLFNRNVIVDLSRVGSSETKSLIMGILVLKLQEYRMEQWANNPGLNSELKHITVLEEAHNLLKRVSLEQVGEGANLTGKSVEMLSNSIAEMRTYGEGFIIADQSPGLLDMSVIRNTNTKIIMKLPDYSDRELVGRAAGLNDAQITEISRFERGVASVTQSDWLEPVLCMIDEYKVDEKSLCVEEADTAFDNISGKTDNVTESVLDCIMNKEIYREGDRVDIRKLRSVVLKSGLETSIKCKFIDYIDAGKEDAIAELQSLVYEFFHAEKAIDMSKKIGDVEQWVHRVVGELNPSIGAYSPEQIDLLVGLILYEKSLQDMSYNDLFCRYTELFENNGGVY